MADEEEIRAAEARLGLRLPPSYREHMLGSAALPGAHGLALLPVSRIDRFGRLEPEWLAGWMQGWDAAATMPAPEGRLRDDPADPATMATDQLAGTVVVSTVSDERILLMNPAAIDESGEWESWDFANWYPGAYRYPSFADLAKAIARGD
jgi:hypothetical protein